LKRQQPEVKALASRVMARRKQALKQAKTDGGSDDDSGDAADGSGDAGSGDSRGSRAAVDVTPTGPASPEQLREYARVQTGERNQPKRQSRRKRR